MKDKLEVKMKEEIKSKLMEQQQNQNGAQFAHGGTQVKHNLVDYDMMMMMMMTICPKNIFCRDQDIRST